jgi:D-ribose pyranose/furanose isomerase RbsD
VKRQVRELGFRNWIVIAESSFPAYSRPRASQVAAEAESPEVLSYVLQVIAETQHVRPNVFLTRELRSMSNDTAPGIDEWKRKTQQALLGMETTSLEQESLMSLVADANRSFEVLVVRTSSALPYSSIFIELQPGYWDAEAEQQLRARMEQERQQYKRSAAKNL